MVADCQDERRPAEFFPERPPVQVKLEEVRLE